MFGKRGSVLTTEELVKLVLGILVLVVLIMLLVALVNIVLASKEKAQATKTLNDLEYTVNVIPEGSVANFFIESPKDWILISFPIQNAKELCFCPKSLNGIVLGTTDTNENYQSCKNSGICKNFNMPISIVTQDGYRNIEIYTFRDVFIDKKEGTVSISTSEKSATHSTRLDDFLNSEMVVNGVTLKIYEEMIRVIKKTSSYGVDAAGHTFFDKDFGARGWCLEYSKQGNPSGTEDKYPYQWKDAGACELRGGGKTASWSELTKEYDTGILKVRFYAIKGN